MVISKTPPGDWEGTVIVIGKGTDGNIWQTKTTDGKPGRRRSSSNAKRPAGSAGRLWRGPGDVVFSIAAR